MILPAFLHYAFFVRALVAATLVSFLAANLGVFVVLRRLAFFSDAIAHASLTGIALGLLLGVDPIVGAVAFCVLIALSISALARRKSVSIDTLIGVFFSTALALGVIVISSLKGYRVDLFGYLFGDILGVSTTDLWYVAALAVATTVAIAVFFRTWAKIAFHPDLARVEGVDVVLHDRIFLAFLAVVIALGIKLVGVVLIGSLVIIPAATAKNLSWDMRSLMPIASAVAIGAAISGLVASYYLDTPSGPTVVLVAAAAFALSYLARPRTVRE